MAVGEATSIERQAAYGKPSTVPFSVATNGTFTVAPNTWAAAKSVMVVKATTHPLAPRNRRPMRCVHTVLLRLCEAPLASEPPAVGPMDFSVTHLVNQERSPSWDNLPRAPQPEWQGPSCLVTSRRFSAWPSLPVDPRCVRSAVFRRQLGCLYRRHASAIGILASVRPLSLPAGISLDGSDPSPTRKCRRKSRGKKETMHGIGTGGSLPSRPLPHVSVRPRRPPEQKPLAGEGLREIVHGTGTGPAAELRGVRVSSALDRRTHRAGHGAVSCARYRRRCRATAHGPVRSSAIQRS